MTAEFIQIKGIWRDEPTDVYVGNVRQIRHIRVGEERIHWIICVPMIDERCLIISRNGENKTVLVEDDYGWAWKVMKRCVKANGGAKGLYKDLVRNLEGKSACWYYDVLEKIWCKTKSIFK